MIFIRIFQVEISNTLALDEEGGVLGNVQFSCNLLLSDTGVGCFFKKRRLKMLDFFVKSAINILN